MLQAFLPATVVAVLMSAIYVLPPFRQVESAMDTDITSFIGVWETRTYPPSEQEIKILAADTEFSKAHCFRRRYEETSLIDGTPTDVVDLSIVLSGYDLANSIHRPERCMPAQGHKLLRSVASTLELRNGRTLPVTRLLSRQTISHGPPDDRQFLTRDALTYYFFVGHRQVTESHTERTLIDIKDRILGGEAQRWAYISATMPYVEDGGREFGGPPDLEMADRKVRQLLSELADSHIRWERITD